MLLLAYYARNYAGIIGASLTIIVWCAVVILLLSCRIGAAIVVEDGPPVIPPVFRNSNVHSLCFLQFSNLSFPLKPGQVSI